MTSRERVLATLKFQTTDHVPYGLAEGRIWPQLCDYFLEEHGLKDKDEISNFLDMDFRWIEPDSPEQRAFALTKKDLEVFDFSNGPLSSAITVGDVDRLYPINVPQFDCVDFKSFREKWPNHAIVLNSLAIPYFWASCMQFGATEVFYKIHDYPEVYEALLQRMEVGSKAIIVNFLENAKDYIDIVSIWDDFAGQNGMMVDPSWWRKVLKPYYKREVELIHNYGKKVFFHSCGAVRPILGDLIEIGVDALTVFQVNAKGMDPKSIAKDFGGKLCFYGGIDVQHLLSYGSPEEVEAQVKYNIDCFRDYGGYIIANCHTICTIKERNILTMCQTAKSYVTTHP